MSNIEIIIQEQPIQIELAGGVGPPGPPGPEGPEGPPGGGGSATVTFEQQAASDHWVITHDWPGGYPSITVVDTSGNVVEGDYVYTSSTQIDLYFTLPFSGKAYLN